jgi:hypothetical protein
VGHPPSRRSSPAHGPRAFDPGRFAVSRPAGAAAPRQYDVRIEGHLDPHWSTWFGGLALIAEDDGTTVLRGVVADQAELHGLLAKVRDLGATLISVTPTIAARDGDPDLQRDH